MASQARIETSARTHSFLHCIQGLAHPESGEAGLDTAEAKLLFAAMLDGGVPELELGGLLVALGVRQLDVQTLLGFSDALAERVLQLQLTSSGRHPVIIPSYGG